MTLNNTQRYVRKPFPVEAVRIDNENMDEVADWCRGSVIATGDTARVKVPVINQNVKSEGFVGDWVLRSGNSFRVYSNEVFQKSFVENPISTTVYPESA